MATRAVISLAILTALIVGCGPTPEATYDYRWQILGAKQWQEQVRPSTGDGEGSSTGMLLQWNFDGIQRKPNDVIARISLWRYPLDTALVVTKQKESLPDGTYEVTRMYYEIRNKPMQFDVVIIPGRENTLLVRPGKYFVHVSPASYSDIRIKEVIVKPERLSVLNLSLVEQRLE
jgi:hypothetical protein